MMTRIDLPTSEILTQLAEECTELAQAALKMRRALDGTNPTPKSVEECRMALSEEYGDVMICAAELILRGDIELEVADVFMRKKRQRWSERLSGAGGTEQ